MSIDKADKIIELIKGQAIAKWGDSWMPCLVRRYAELESEEVGREIPPTDRRPQLGRVLEGISSPSLPTALRLLAAIDGEIEIQILKRENLRI
jgi:hypothetical protein